MLTTWPPLWLEHLGDGELRSSRGSGACVVKSADLRYTRILERAAAAIVAPGGSRTWLAGHLARLPDVTLVPTQEQVKTSVGLVHWITRLGRRHG
jgi:hypothetical protein